MGTLLLPGAQAHAVTLPGVTVCEIQAVVGIDRPGLTAMPRSFTSNISGELSSSLGSSDPACGSTTSGAPTGTPIFNAGGAYAVTVSGTGWSVTYALPESTGFGSCAMSTTSGVVIAAWPDGTHTVVDYSTVGVGQFWLLHGTVVRSATLNEVSSTGTPPPGTPATLTVKSSNPAFPVNTRFSGESTFITVGGDPTCSGSSFAGVEGVVRFFDF